MGTQRIFKNTWHNDRYKRGMDVEVIRRDTEYGVVFDVFLSNPYVGRKRVDILDRQIREIHHITEENVEDYVEIFKSEYLYRFFNEEEVEDYLDQDKSDLPKRPQIRGKCDEEQNTGTWNRYLYNYHFEITEEETEYGWRYELFVFHPDNGKKKRVYSWLKEKKCNDLVDREIDEHAIHFIQLYSSGDEDEEMDYSTLSLI